MALTNAQITTLKLTINYADHYHNECEEANYSDTGELWHIIEMFTGVSIQILDSQH